MTDNRRGARAMHRARFAINGVMRTWWAVRRPTTLGVKLLLVAGDGRVVLVRHSYQDGLYLPGGGVKRRESFRHAAVREASEELGITVAAEDLRVFGVFYSEQEAKRDHIVAWQASRWQGEPAPRSAEIMEVVLVDAGRPPPDTTPATLRRLAELAAGAAPGSDW